MTGNPMKAAREYWEAKGLSVRTVNGLLNGHYYCSRDLPPDPGVLLRTPNFGLKSLKELSAALGGYYDAALPPRLKTDELARLRHENARLKAKLETVGRALAKLAAQCSIALTISLSAPM